MTRLHFLLENIPSSATTAMTLLPYAGADYHAQQAGRVKSLTVLLTEARTAGTLTLKVTKNGSAQAVLNATINATTARFTEVFGDQDDLTFAPGDRIGLQVVSASFTPTTSDAVGIVELEEGA